MAAIQVLLLRLLYRKQEGLEWQKIKYWIGRNSRLPEHISYMCSSPSSPTQRRSQGYCLQSGTLWSCLGSSRLLLDLQEVEALKGPPRKVSRREDSYPQAGLNHLLSLTLENRGEPALRYDRRPRLKEERPVIA